MKKLTDDEEITKQTYNSQATLWAAQHLARGFWFDEMEEFQEHLPKGSLLEVGCGGGRDAQELIERGYKYIGTDVSLNLIKEARKVNPAADFREVSLYDLNFDQSFDGFWCAAVLLHIPKSRIQEALLAIKNNIKKGAIGFIAIKQGSGEKIENDTGFYKGRRFFAYWNQEEFSNELMKAGFEVVSQNSRKASENTTWITYIVKA